MVKCQRIEFIEANSPIEQAVTKFGGQPVWLEPAQWPLSKSLKTPMRFICQIRLDDHIFPGGDGKMAYIFMTDEEEYVDDAWEPDAGENAVIIQPEGKTDIACADVRRGPCIKKRMQIDGEGPYADVESEFAVKLTNGEDADFIPLEDLADKSDDDAEEHLRTLVGNKVGGTPAFLQGDAFPEGDDGWTLLLQLHSAQVPFDINFGDVGVGYAFINKDATRGKFLWQCC